MQAVDMFYQAQPPHVALSAVRTFERILLGVLLQMSAQLRLAERDVVAIKTVKPCARVVVEVPLELGGVQGGVSALLTVHHVGYAQHAIKRRVSTVYSRWHPLIADRFHVEQAGPINSKL